MEYRYTLQWSSHSQPRSFSESIGGLKGIPEFRRLKIWSVKKAEGMLKFLPQWSIVRSFCHGRPGSALIVLTAASRGPQLHFKHRAPCVKLFGRQPRLQHPSSESED